MFLRPVLAAVLLSGAAAWAQTPAPSASPTPTPSPTPYPINAIAPGADADLAALAQMHNEIAGDDLSDKLHKFIPKLTTDLEKRERQTTELLHSTTKIGALQDEAVSWSVLHDSVMFHLSLLNDKLDQLEQISQKLADMDFVWKATLPTLKAADTPQDLPKKANAVLQQISATNKSVDAKRKELLTLQGTLVSQGTQIDNILAQVTKARGDALSRLPLRDSQPIWHAFQNPSTKQAPLAASMSTQVEIIRSYLAAERGVVLLHITLWVVLFLIFRWARNGVRKLTSADAELNKSTAVFEVPGALAMLVALLLVSPFYAGVSPLLTAILGAALLAPLLRIVGCLIVPSLRPITWALALFYLSAQVREATSAFPIVARLIYLAEMIGGVFFSIWLIRESRGKRSMLWRTLQGAARVGFVLFLVAGSANILGYLNLAQFVSSVMLDSSYVAILLYVATHIVDGLATFALNIRPLTNLSVVRRHRALLDQRSSGLIRAVAVILWVVFVLNKLLLFQPLLDWSKLALNEPFIAGITLGGVLTFIITVWASFLVSRFIRFILEEDIYQRVKLKPGLPFAISTMLHYVVLLVGFYLATAALLGDMSKFTILAGAFGVGVGFGLQNIVNNFVSSIIVLFERPIKIGDLVQVGTQQGTVRQIGIRATIIRSSDGSDVIIPNGKLISDPVTNWTLTSHQRQLQIDLITPVKGVDANQVITLLEQAANESTSVLKAPAPSAILASFGANQLHFDLRIWTDEHQSVRRVRSDLAVAISQALSKNNIPTA